MREVISTRNLRVGAMYDSKPVIGCSKSDRRQDGILGVCAGVEMLRVLHEEKIETKFPVGVVNWTK